MPGGAQGTELTVLTRRAFAPIFPVQIYNASPFMAAMLSNAQAASGGVSSVTVPVQGQPFVNTTWGDFSGTFGQPLTLQGAFVSEFNLKVLLTPIPFLGLEAAVQIDHAIVPLIEARMNDATNNGMDVLAQAVFNNFTTTGQIIGLPGAIDDGTNLVTYGNINRTANPWWQSKHYAMGSVAPTRSRVFQNIVGTNKYGAEMPTMGIMGPGTWTSLAQEFIGIESYQIQPGHGFDSDADRPRSAFRALDVGGVPVYQDPYCPEGILYLINTNYINLYVHDQASFAFSGFESMLSNFQLGYIGVVLTLAELVLTKPKTCSRSDGYTFAAL
jgi:hypothetical protein